MPTPSDSTNPPPGPTLPRERELEGLLAQWLPQQRWYPLKDAVVPPRITGRLELAPASASVHFAVFFVELNPASGERFLLHVPLAIYRNGTAVPNGVGVLSKYDGGTGLGWESAVVRDGLSDPEFLELWLVTAESGRGVLSGAGSGLSVELWRDSFFAASSGQGMRDIRSIATEQSNSSVIFRRGGAQFVAKFFRVLHDGEHPEVVVGRALARDGVAAAPVPRLRAAGALGAAGATLFVVHDFISEATGGWELALSHAADGRSFAHQAGAIGVALAQLHAALRNNPPSASAAAAGIFPTLAQRLAEGWRLVGDAVGPYDLHMENFLAQLSRMDAVAPLQAVHGDLHLGQLLFQERTGKWFVLDFEGEPLRPLAERGQADVALRDVAGMLRSFDYAGAHAAGGIGADARRKWVREAGDAFLSAYAGQAGVTITGGDPLLVALWLDKALYEVAYERQNRPDWAWVPINAVRDFFDSSMKVVWK